MTLKFSHGLLLGALYSIPTTMSAMAGLFHILAYKGALTSELMMGIFQLTIAPLYLIAFMITVWLLNNYYTRTKE